MPSGWFRVDCRWVIRTGYYQEVSHHNEDCVNPPDDLAPGGISPRCMMTSSNGIIFRVTGPSCGEFTGPRWIPRTKKGQWRGALMFSLICARLNCWVNNGDVKVMDLMLMQYVIRMTYNATLGRADDLPQGDTSSGWHTQPPVSHPDEKEIFGIFSTRCCPPLLSYKEPENPIRAKFSIGNTKFVSTFYIIPPHWRDTETFPHTRQEITYFT